MSEVQTIKTRFTRLLIRLFTATKNLVSSNERKILNSVKAKEKYRQNQLHISFQAILALIHRTIHSRMLLRGDYRLSHQTWRM